MVPPRTFLLSRPLPIRLIEDVLAETDVHRRDFHEFVVTNVFERLLQLYRLDRRRMPKYIVNKYKNLYLFTIY